MTASTTRLIVGNWKMNGDAGLIDALAEALAGGGWTDRVVVCPPATLLERAYRCLAPLGVEVGGQDCHAAQMGPHTGDLSATLLAQTGARHVILGHSERRRACGESSQGVLAKAVRAVEAGLRPIMCVGDTSQDRAAGRAVEAVTEQVRALLDGRVRGSGWALAYEPTWAIGSGRAAAQNDILRMHQAIRAVLDEMSDEYPPILYGGAVTEANASVILATPQVGGLLIGGAALHAAQFSRILRGASLVEALD